MIKCRWQALILPPQITSSWTFAYMCDALRCDYGDERDGLNSLCIDHMTASSRLGLWTPRQWRFYKSALVPQVSYWRVERHAQRRGNCAGRLDLREVIIYKHCLECHRPSDYLLLTSVWPKRISYVQSRSCLRRPSSRLSRPVTVSRFLYDVKDGPGIDAGNFFVNFRWTDSSS